MSINDEKKSDLTTAGYSNSVNSAEVDWLIAQGASGKSIEDLWKSYLVGEGYSGSLTDMMKTWLVAKGYSGSLTKMIIDALSADDFYGAAGYTASATKFDGTNDYISRGADLTGITDGKQGTISLWLNLNGGDGALQYITVGSNVGIRFSIARTATNVFNIVGKNAAGSTILNVLSDTTYTSSATWLHVLASWDLATATGYLYVNDADDLAAGTTLTNDTIDYTKGDWIVGGRPSGNRLNGCLSEYWFDDSYLDISTEANRRKFIDASGKPVDLGSDGSTPTGASPLIYLPNAYDTFEQNAGTGGDFTVTGALEACASSPSD